MAAKKVSKLKNVPMFGYIPVNNLTLKLRPFYDLPDEVITKRIIDVTFKINEIESKLQRKMFSNEPASITENEIVVLNHYVNLEFAYNKETALRN